MQQRTPESERDKRFRSESANKDEGKTGRHKRERWVSLMRSPGRLVLLLLFPKKAVFEQRRQDHDGALGARD
jgi:hypothetical protein